ncbi:MAG: hypothetical protein P8Y95_12725 [Gammaproteobacteria bacterium]|jgi:hypothetical protein
MAEQTDSTKSRLDFRDVMIKLRTGEARLDELPQVAVERLCDMYKTTSEKLQARFDAGIERERNSPTPGKRAPDFNLERLDANGVRTGEFVRLHDNLDKPVGLIFGSYT